MKINIIKLLSYLDGGDYHQVRKIQREIVEATRQKDMKKLYEGQLSLIKYKDAIECAVLRVHGYYGNRLQGLDYEVAIKTAEEGDELIVWLKEMVDEPERYEAIPLHTVMNKDKYTDERNTLTTPTKKDLARQLLYYRATDPVVEEMSDRYSFGYRQGRSANQAVRVRWEQYSSQFGPEWGFKTKVENLLGQIDPNRLREMSPNQYGARFLEKWLKEGTLSYKVHMYPEQEIGQLTGNILSHMLGNMVLNGMEEHIVKTCGRNKVLRVRYVDDIVVMMRDPKQEDMVREARASFLSKRKLKIMDVKTKMFNIREGFDFCGWNIRKWKRDVVNHDVQGVKGEIVKMKPSSEAVNRICKRLRGVIKKHGDDGTAMIKERNMYLEQWIKYYSCSYHSDKAFEKLEKELWKGKMNYYVNKYHDYHVQGVIPEKWIWEESGKTRIIPSTAKLNPPKFKDVSNFVKERGKNPYVEGCPCIKYTKSA